MRGVRTPAGTMMARGEWYDGKFFRSQLEKHRYIELVMLEQAGAIADLKCQPKFPIYVAGTMAMLLGKKPVLGCTYVADFKYRQTTDNAVVIEDTKGFKTPEYLLKKRMAEAAYSISIVEVTAAGERRSRRRRRR